MRLAGQAVARALNVVDIVAANHITNGRVTMNKQSDVKTIHEFLADNPNVDVSNQWERMWDIHNKKTRAC